MSGEVAAIIKGQNDLRKLYSPPMKQTMLPSKNPFFNGQIIDYMNSSSTTAQEKSRNMSQTAYNIFFSQQKDSMQQYLNNTDYKIMSTDRKVHKLIKARATYLQYAFSSSGITSGQKSILEPSIIKNQSAYNQKVDRILQSPY